MTVLTIDDLIFAYSHNLACRHTSSEKDFRYELSNDTYGDAYAIGASHLLTYTPDERANDSILQQSFIARTMAALSGGKSDLDYIKDGGESLINLYKMEIKKMVRHAVEYDERHNTAEDCHLTIYIDSQSTKVPYDIHSYPFGKCGKQNLFASNICAGIFLDESDKIECKGNVDRMVDCLTTKTLNALHLIRERRESISSSALRTQTLF